MAVFEDDIGAALARARRQFPDHRPDAAYRVCLPVYEVTLTCIIHEGRESVADGACWTASGASRTWRRARQEA